MFQVNVSQLIVPTGIVRYVLGDNLLQNPAAVACPHQTEPKEIQANRIHQISLNKSMVSCCFNNNQKNFATLPIEQQRKIVRFLKLSEKKGRLTGLVLTGYLITCKVVSQYLGDSMVRTKCLGISAQISALLPLKRLCLRTVNLHYGPLCKHGVC